ncbi:MAG: DUF4386 domain-containing protein [Bacteroidetes bacterium]|nr:DUF4386 domain-containing protein [Bacteroidota bacterium]
MDEQQKELVSAARAAGIWYLVLAIAGVLGFLVLHPQVYVAGQVSQTVAHLQEQDMLARWRLLLEFVIILSQALAAVYFFKLFKDVNHFAAWCLAAWGMMNAAAIMISAMAMGGAIQVANTELPVNEKLVMVQIFVQVIKNAWGVGSLFFGLWLIPMGYIVLSSQRMPVWLGRTLIVGGIGYIASTFLNYGGLEYSWIDLLTIPASISEFWMIGYLLIFGIRARK